MNSGFGPGAKLVDLLPPEMRWLAGSAPATPDELQSAFDLL